MDRAQPGARGSTNRNIEFGETTSQYSDGWIVPSDEPTLSAQRYTSLDETAFNEFDAAYGVDSLTVTIEPGEAFVDGWLARDTATDINLAADTNEQVVVVGWDPDAIYDDQQHNTRDEADRVIVDLKSNVDSTHPTVAVWEFNTDGSGVTNINDRRTLGRDLNAERLVGKSRVEHLVDSPNGTPPIALLEDTESVEITVVVPDGETLKVYRWGGYKIADGTAPPGLRAELLDGGDTVQANENTTDTESTDPASPIASHTNSSGSLSVFKLRAYNATGNSYTTDGVGSHFAYIVE
jgi:hypothetical protein